LEEKLKGPRMRRAPCAFSHVSAAPAKARMTLMSSTVSSQPKWPVSLRYFSWCSRQNWAEMRPTTSPARRATNSSPSACWK